MKKFLFSALLILIFNVLFLIASKPNEVHAEVGCWLNEVIQNGVSINPVLKDAEPNIPFNIKVNCTSFTDSSPHDVTVTINGNSSTRTGLIGVPSVEFGPYPGMPGGVYPLSFYIAGLADTVKCTASSDRQCRLYIRGDPEATLLPGPNCLIFRSYNPETPSINQEFQIQFSLNGTIISNGVSKYKVEYTVNGGTGGSLTPTDASTSFGIWFVTIPAVDGQVDWDVLFDGTKCGTSGTTLIGAVGTGTPGQNPCTTGTSGECVTGLGKISTNLGSFASRILAIALGIAGGLALILMVFGAVRVMTSSGNPQNAAQGREIMTAAVAGLLFIAFAVLILQFIGVVIVPIPGLTFGIPS